MKKIFKISALLLSLFIGISCENDNQTIVSPNGGPELLSPTDGSEYILLPENASNEATTLVWNHADYGVQTEVNYEVQVALAGTDFATIESGGSTNNRFLSWTVEQLNTVMLNLGALPYETTDIEVRIKSSLGANSDLVDYSNFITLSVSSYTTEIPKLWVVGNFLAAGGYGNDWTPSNAVPLASSGFGETDFEGYVFFNTPNFEFLLLPTTNDFVGKFGDDGSFSGALEVEGANIVGTGAGYYRVMANTTTLTYSTAITNWAVTGSGTPNGWPDNGVVDHNLTYNPTTKKWEIILALSAGGNEIKFRANDAWDLNYGDTGADGSLNEGGDNIVVPAAGTYLIELDLSNPRAYTYTLTLQ